MCAGTLSGVRPSIPILLVAGLVGATTLAATVTAWQETRTSFLETSGWDSVSAHGFGTVSHALVEGWRGSEGMPTAEIEVLADALAGDAERAARAAVLLGAEGGERARSALLDRLDQRIAAPSRGATGVDVIAARALHEGITEKETERLAELVQGTEPHPDLAVRVECARAVLLGADHRAVVPFLLTVLRAETPAQEKSPITWPRITTLAWVKTRAAQALSRAAGTDLRFRPDGSWAHQVAEAERLEGLLR